MKPRELVLALRAMGLTQKQIQERTGISQPTVSKIGLGRVSDVMSRHYLALLNAYEQQAEGAGGGAPALQALPSGPASMNELSAPHRPSSSGLWLDRALCALLALLSFAALIYGFLTASRASWAAWRPSGWPARWAAGMVLCDNETLRRST
jgi:transcriptional regulator with XRE-family HTH domain